MITIKRYPNRKLYNTESKQYITLEALADLIQEGEEIQVLDTSNGADLTVLTLTQVLFGQIKKQATFLPFGLLSGLIRAGSQSVASLHERAAILGNGRQINNEIERRIQEIVERGDLTEQEGSSLIDKLTFADEKEPAQSPPEAKFVSSLLERRGFASRSEIFKLAEQVENLTQAVDQLAQKETKPTSRETLDKKSAQ